MYKLSDVFCVLGSMVRAGQEKQLSDIKKYLSKYPNGWDPNDLRREIILNIPVKNALKEWLETIKTAETKRKYQRAIEKLFFEDPSVTKIDPDLSVTGLDAGGTTGVFTHIEEQWTGTESMKRICLIAYSQFCDYIRTETLGLVDPELGPHDKKRLIEAEELYEEVNWNQFINALPSPYNLMAELAIITARNTQFRIKISDSSENNLNSMETSQIDFEKGTISIPSKQSYHAVGLLWKYPDEFMKKLKNYIGGRSGLVFVTRNGTKLSHKQANRAFSKTSKDLNLKTPISYSIISWIGCLMGKEDQNQEFDKRFST
jgi:hypothetical protein